MILFGNKTFRPKGLHQLYRNNNNKNALVYIIHKHKNVIHTLLN